MWEYGGENKRNVKDSALKIKEKKGSLRKKKRS